MTIFKNIFLKNENYHYNSKINYCSENILEVKNITKIYGKDESSVYALKGISLKIKKNAFVMITGESGSGKSTLLTVIAGLNRPTDGEVFINGISLYNDLNMDDQSLFRNRNIGYVFQSFQLVPYLNAIENVMLPLAIKRIRSKDKIEKAHEVLRRVGLIHKAYKLPGELSGGQQQRVAIARSLVNNPMLILADEPTGNLDSLTRMEIINLFETIRSEDKSTVIMVSHNLSDIGFKFDEIDIKDGMINNYHKKTK